MIRATPMRAVRDARALRAPNLEALRAALTASCAAWVIAVGMHSDAGTAEETPHSLAAPHARADADARFVRERALAVVASAAVRPGERIPNGPTNTTGRTLRLPGGTQGYYPAFWIRDAAFMLGGDLIAADEIEGWVRVIAATQAGANGLRFGELRVPPYSIPDHITLAGEACWYPGAYTEQGHGAYGYLPPADDAFFFIQMVHEHWRLTGRLALFRASVATPWGTPCVSEVCARAFDSVAVDAATGLVVCEAGAGRTRVDWGFCDAIRKTGLCLMPSLLRWRAARALAELFSADGDPQGARRLRAEAARIRAAIPAVFAQPVLRSDGRRETRLLSAAGLGRKDDAWASAYAVWLGALPRDTARAVARHLLALYEAGGTVVEGQVRHLPPGGEFGGSWEQAACEPGTYQNGGYWATPTGWWIAALRRVSPHASERLRADYVAHLRAHADEGAPWEWIQPARNLRVNPLYGSSVALVYLSANSAGGPAPSPRPAAGVFRKRKGAVRRVRCRCRARRPGLATADRVRVGRPSPAVS